MELQEIETRFREIRSKNDYVSLDLFMDEIESSEDSADFFIKYIDRKPSVLYFILINRSNNNDYLKQIRTLFEKTSWNLKIKKSLSFPDAVVRRFFIKEIGMARSSIFFKILIDKLKDGDFEVRKDIINNMAKFNSDMSLSILVSLLDDLDARIIKELSNIFCSMGSEAVPHLTKHISSPSVRLRSNILDVLKRIGTLDVITPILYLSSDNSDEIRMSAQQYLISLTDKVTLSNNTAEVKKLMDFLLEQLEKNDPRLLNVTIKSIMKFRKEGAEVLINKLESIETGTLRSEMFSIIKDSKAPEKIYLLFEMILSSDIEIKEKGLDILQKYYFDDKYEEAILLLLQDFCLKNMKSISSIEKEAVSNFIIRQKLLERIVKNLRLPDPAQRIASINMIGIISDPKTAPLLLTLNKDPVWEVRAAVIRVLGSLVSEPLLPNFQEMLDDPEINVQVSAIDAIGKLKSSKAREIIFRYIESPNHRLREAAAQVIAKESLKKYIDSFDTLNEKSKMRVAKLMEILDVETEKILSSEIKSLNPEERRRVLEIISHLNNKSKFKKIVNQAIKDPDKNIRAMVVTLLVQLEDKEMVVELLKLLNDPDKRVKANVIEAVASLDKINSQSIINLLIPFLKDNNNRIRANAVMSLYTLGYQISIEETSVMMRDPSEFMRASAVYCIGKLELKEKADYLYSFKSDPSVLVRKNLIRAFGKLGKDNYISYFLNDPSQDVKILAKEVMSKKGGDIK